jgi:hypothetical protein
MSKLSPVLERQAMTPSPGRRQWHELHTDVSSFGPTLLASLMPTSRANLPRESTGPPPAAKTRCRCPRTVHSSAPILVGTVRYRWCRRSSFAFGSELNSFSGGAAAVPCRNVRQTTADAWASADVWKGLVGARRDAVALTTGCDSYTATH